MNVCILTVFIALPIFFVEMLALYLWFAKVYLSGKGITVEQFIKRVKLIRKQRDRLKKGVLIDKHVKRLLKENEFCFIEISMALICVPMFIFAIFSSMLLTIVTTFVPMPFTIPADVFMVVMLISVAGGVHGVFSKSFVEELDSYNKFYRKLKNIDEAESDVENILLNSSNENTLDLSETEGEQVTIWFWIGIMFAVLAGIVVLYDSTIDLFDLINGSLDWSDFFGFEKLCSPTYIIFYIFIFVVFVMLLIDDLLGKKRTISAIKRMVWREHSIMIVPALEPWKENIYCMCRKLKINTIELIVYDDEGTDLASSVLSTNKCPVIRLGKYRMEKFERSIGYDIYYDMILFLLAHELAHIHYGDLSEKRNREIMGGTLIIAFACYFFLGSIIFRINIYAGICMALVFILFVFGIVFTVFVDSRYWKQIDELRADRLGLQISETQNTFNIFIGYLAETEEKKGDWEKNIYPRLKTRVREIERYGKTSWGIKDYLRYSWQFFWMVKFHKEWRF